MAVIETLEDVKKQILATFAPLTRAVEIVREDRATDYDEYRLLRPFARKLLREVVSLLDKRTCRQIFDEARDITRRLRVSAAG